MIELSKQKVMDENKTNYYDLEKIKTLIPHRYPMLMIDKVTNIIQGISAVGIKCVTNNEPFFQGHFPKKAVMPGVLIIEAMAQTAAVVVIDSLNPSSRGDIVYFMSIDSARFRKPVHPGDKLELHVQMIQNRKNVWKFEGKGIVDNVIHASAIYTAMIMDNEG